MVSEKVTNLNENSHNEYHSIRKDSVVHSDTGHRLGGFTHQNQ